jgi:PIN domain nuclease of toxin-antitoxin system
VTYLFDTHTWLWLLLEPDRIGPKTRSLVLQRGHEFCLSIASAWEIAIKHVAGRLVLPEAPLQYINSRTTEDGVRLLSVRLEHVCSAAGLPRHHADPFDRLLIAQARIEGMQFMSHDQAVCRYDVQVVDPTE